MLKNIILTILILAAPAFALDVSIPKNERSEFTVDVDDASGIAAYQFELCYDPNVIADPVCSTQGTLAEPMNVICNESEPGHLQVAAFGVYELAGSGPVLRVAFRSKAPGETKVVFDNAYFFGLISIIPANISGGVVTGGERCSLITDIAGVCF
jgi:hypothetical protein